jgi:NADH:ubiquinone oxidoreductase subunit
VLKYLLTWWNGSTPGASFTIAKRATYVGQDDYGNKYYEAKKIIDGDAGRRRRYVKYRGYAEPSKVPAEWHGWLHHTFELPPTQEPLKRQPWEQDHLPNLTGTRFALKPAGSIARGGTRPSATGDYQAWKP